MSGPREPAAFFDFRCSSDQGCAYELVPPDPDRHPAWTRAGARSENSSPKGVIVNKTRAPRALLLAALAGLAAPALAQPVLTQPEGSEVSRGLTAAERAWLRDHPIRVPEAATPAPVGPVRCVAEYEPMEGLIVAWEGPSGQTTILRDMIKEITTTNATAADNAVVYVVVDTVSEQTTVNNTLIPRGVNMARVKYVTRATDTIWLRDYGPRYVYQGDVRAITDHVYNRPRPNDDTLPSYFSTFKKHPYYEHTLVHGGGNFHLNALNKAYCTELILNENPSLTTAQVLGIWQNYQALDTHIFPPFPASVDSTQHIDMWMQVIGDNKVIIGDWDLNRGSTQDTVCNDAAAYMASQGYTVYRTPSRSIGGVHYTYTNMVIVNKLVLLPTFTGVDATTNTNAFNAVSAAFGPEYTIKQIGSDALATSAGVMHCIVQHLPKNKNGINPGAVVITPRAGATVTPGQNYAISWGSDDDVAVTKVDLQLSTDGGNSYSTIATNLAPVDASQTKGSWTWTVPDVFSPQARVRVIAYDADGNTGSADGGNFLINGTPCNADVTLDGIVDLEDFFSFLNCFDQTLPCADIDGASGVDLGDFFFFLNAFDSGCN
jgi:agmatine/peptidylarginine deiminase